MARSASKFLLALFGFLAPTAVVFWLMFLSVICEWGVVAPIGLHDVPTEGAERAFRAEWNLPKLRVEKAAEEYRTPAEAAVRWYRIVVPPDDVSDLKESRGRQYEHWAVVRGTSAVPKRVTIRTGRELLARLRRGRSACPTWWRPEDLWDADVVQYDSVGPRTLYVFSRLSGTVYCFQEGD